MTLRALQFDGEVHLRFVDVEVFAVGLVPGGEDLDAQFSVGDSVKARLPFRVGLQFHAALALLSISPDGMHDDAGAAQWLSVVVFQHLET